jgi:hypothetical protein
MGILKLDECFARELLIHESDTNIVKARCSYRSFQDITTPSGKRKESCAQNEGCP